MMIEAFRQLDITEKSFFPENHMLNRKLASVLKQGTLALFSALILKISEQKTGLLSKGKLGGTRGLVSSQIIPSDLTGS
jgi:hypothetical protein